MARRLSRPLGGRSEIKTMSPRANRSSTRGPHQALLAYGQTLSGQSSVRFIHFTNDPAADELLNDLGRYPHAFLLGVIADRQVKAERAWIIPWKAKERFGTAEYSEWRRKRLATWVRFFKGPPSLHRFATDMATNFTLALERVEKKYDGNAAEIWNDRPSSAELVLRFLEFPGIGPKLATMATNLLATRMGVKLRDYYSVDVSADVHVRRVFRRTGLVEADASVDQVIYRARSIHPEFPGALDEPAFHIGRNWCKAHNPLCGACPLGDGCPRR